MGNLVPKIAFLGLCDKIAHIREGHPVNWKINLIGLRSALFSYIFPLNIKGLNFFFAVYDAERLEKTKVSLRDLDNNEVMNISLSQEEHDATGVTETNKKPASLLTFATNKNWACWSTFPYTADIDILINKPGPLKLFLQTKENEICIGGLDVLELVPPAFSEEYITACKASPFAAKEVEFHYGCNICGKTIKTYAALERKETLEKEGKVWFQNLPDNFECECKKNSVDFSYIKKNLHGLLMVGQKINQNFSMQKMYDLDALEHVIKEFRRTIDSKPSEEIIQKFMEKSPITLQTFSPIKIFFKKPILSSYKTDFCVLNNKKELLLIEIEKSDLPLMKKDGKPRAELENAINQVRDWIHKTKSERSAVITEIGLKSSEITKIRGIVICGMDKEYDEEKLHKLKSIDFGEVEFFTYSDIIKSLVGLTDRMREI